MRVAFLLILLLVLACAGDGAGRFGVSDLDIRGLVAISEVHWAGSVLADGSQADPDDDFIELTSYYDAPLAVGGWVLTVEGRTRELVVLPRGAVLFPGTPYVIVRHTNGAFPRADHVHAGLALPATGFAIRLTDGGGAKYADSLDFSAGIPGGMDLPARRASTVRVTDYFGAKDGGAPGSWALYNAPLGTNIAAAYAASVFASPGHVLGGVEGSGGGDEQ